MSETPVVPKATAFVQDLYTVESVAADLPELYPDAIETQFLSRIDNDAARVLPRLLEDDTASVTDADRSAWAVFLNSLLERTPQVLAEREPVALAKAHKVVDDLRARARTVEAQARAEATIANMDLHAMARRTVREHMMNAIRDPEVVNYFKNCIWSVIAVRGVVEFITSDVPIVVNAGIEPTPIRMLALALRPDKLFLMYSKAWADEFDTELLQLTVLHHNFAVIEGAGRCIYSRGPLRDGLIVQTRKATDQLLRAGLDPASWSRTVLRSV